MSEDDFDLRPTRDHWPIPKSKGGTQTVICCGQCNALKSNMTRQEWDAFMTANPRWWLHNRKERRAALRVIREAALPVPA